MTATKTQLSEVSVCIELTARAAGCRGARKQIKINSLFRLPSAKQLFGWSLFIVRRPLVNGANELSPGNGALERRPANEKRFARFGQGKRRRINRRSCKTGKMFARSTHKFATGTTTTTTTTTSKRNMCFVKLCFVRMKSDRRRTIGVANLLLSSGAHSAHRRPLLRAGSSASLTSAEVRGGYKLRQSCARKQLQPTTKTARINRSNPN